MKMILGIAIFFGTLFSCVARGGGVPLEEGVSAMVKAIEKAKKEGDEQVIQLDEGTLQRMLLSFGITPEQQNPVRQQHAPPNVDALLKKVSPTSEDLVDRNAGLTSIVRNLIQDASPEQPIRYLIRFSEVGTLALNEVRQELDGVLISYVARDASNQNIGQVLNILRNPFPAIDPELAQRLFLSGIKIFHGDLLRERFYPVLSYDQLTAGHFFPLLFQATEQVVHINEMEADFHYSSSSKKIEPPAEKQGFKVSCVIGLPRLAVLFLEIGQLAEIMSQENAELANNLRIQGVADEIIAAISRDQADWNYYSRIGSLHADLTSAFVMYQFLVSIKGNFKCSSLTQQSGTKIAALSRCEVHAYRLMKAWLRPYAELFAEINNFSLEADDNDLDEGTIARFIELHAQKFRKVGRKKEKEYRAFAGKQADTSKNKPSSKPEEKKEVDTFFPSETEEVIARARERRRRKEEKKLSASQESRSEKEKEVDHSQKQHKKAQKRRNIRREKARQREENENEKEKESQQEPQAIERIWALWPSERDEFLRFLKRDGLEKLPAYNAFIDPYSKDSCVTQEEIDQFFKYIAIASRKFLSEKQYSGQAIENFMEAFLSYALSTGHQLHGDSQSIIYRLTT